MSSFALANAASEAPPIKAKPSLPYAEKIEGTTHIYHIDGTSSIDHTNKLTTLDLRKSSAPSFPTTHKSPISDTQFRAELAAVHASSYKKYKKTAPDDKVFFENKNEDFKLEVKEKSIFEGAIGLRMKNEYTRIPIASALVFPAKLKQQLVVSSDKEVKGLLYVDPVTFVSSNSDVFMVKDVEKQMKTIHGKDTYIFTVSKSHLKVAQGQGKVLLAGLNGGLCGHEIHVIK
jgi:hypothetical protein